jgi:hypothetical protein
MTNQHPAPNNHFGLQIDADELRRQLPQPLLPQRPGYERLYWRVWELGARMVRHGTPENGFAPLYADAAFGGNIFQWDTCFLAAFARYGDELLPVMPALDNFYRRQHSDGYIAREYRWSNGAALWAKGSADSVNPPLFAWAEWLMYLVHGRHARLLAVWPHLERYWAWLHHNRRLPNGLYWSSQLGCGMDNAPRAGAAWVDLSMQQAFNALCMACIADVLGDAPAAARYQGEHAALAGAINAQMWDETTRCYHDLDDVGGPVPSRTLAPFWALLAEVAPPERATQLAAHLADESTFWRMHPFPTLAADDPLYAPHGDYWRGGVWAPTNYAVISGLAGAGFAPQARAATLRHLDAMLAVLEATGTIWENYCADEAAPGSPARPDFVGWSGLGPIALLIEQIIGVELDAPNAVVRWRVAEAGPHGIAQLPFAGDRIGLWTDGAGRFEVTTARPLHLVLSGQYQAERAIPAGGITFVQG